MYKARLQLARLLFVGVTMIWCLLVMAQAQTAEYVDSRLCARCHGQIYENYRQTVMAKSLFKPAPANTIEDYKGNTRFYHSLSDTHFSMIFRDQAYYQRRWQIGSDGNETNVEELKIDYVIGVGDHSRAYLHRTTRGTLIELPLGWSTYVKPQPAQTRMSSAKQPRPSSESAIIRLPT